MAPERRSDEYLYWLAIKEAILLRLGIGWRIQFYLLDREVLVFVNSLVVRSDNLNLFTN